MYPLSNIAIVTPPAIEPVSLGDAKLHLRLDYNDDDALVTALIMAAREHVERYTSRAFITQTFDFYRDQFPGTKPYPSTPIIEIPRPPLQSITSLKFTDTAGTIHTWTASGTDLLNEQGAVNAHIDTINEPGRIVLAYSQIWPNQVLKTALAIRIRCVAGYGDDTAVPQAAVAAMKLLIGNWYQNREAVTSGTLLEALPLPFGVDALLAPLKNWNFA